MSQIALQIKEVYLDEIISGKKTSEFRDFKNFYISRLLNLNSKGEIESAKKFDTIKLYLGNVKNGRYVICEVKDIFVNEYQNKIPAGLKKGDCLFEI